MNKVLIFILEGEKKVFYKLLMEQMKQINPHNKEIFAEIKYMNASGICNFKTKVISKLNKEYFNNFKYKDYEKLLCVCYDQDVFSTPNKPYDMRSVIKALNDIFKKTDYRNKTKSRY